MLPVFQKIEANINHSFFVDHMKFKYFPNPLQFHPEIEILLVLQGYGTRIIGDSIKHFEAGELVIIGENVPHVWVSDKKFALDNTNLVTEIIFVLFKKDIFGDQFWKLPESKNILEIIQLSQRGLKLKGDTKLKVTSIMKSISKSSGFKRIALLMSLLEIISSKREFQLLTSPSVHETINKNDSKRLNNVYQYTINNFSQELTLENAASIANLSVPAFCRYFKKRTNKTYVSFLNEIRIAQACRFLSNEDLSITSICYNCGYTSVSYFIKKFKEITGFTPLNYKKNKIKTWLPLT